MASYLIRSDYNKVIQETNLDALITSSSAILDASQVAALTEAKSFLNSKYDIDAEFTDTVPWAYGTTYKANDRVYLDATAYSASSTYALNALTLQAGNVYICTTAITVAEAFTIGKWTLLGAQYSLFFVTLPYPVFNYTSIYAVGDQIFYVNKTYTAVKATEILSHQGQLQVGQILNTNVQNIFPNDTINGVSYWGTGTAYTVAAGTLPTDTSKWTAGDNRDQKMLMCVLDIVLYHLHSRISPRNVPELRVDRYIGKTEDRVVMKNKIIYPVYCALGWLQSINVSEDVQPTKLNAYQPTQGGRIRYGGVPKNQNSY